MQVHRTSSRRPSPTKTEASGPRPLGKVVIHDGIERLSTLRRIRTSADLGAFPKRAGLDSTPGTGRPVEL